MATAILFSLTIVCAGFAGLRILGVAKGALSLGLTPAAGLAVLAIVSTWCVLLGVPPPLPGIAVFAVALVGLGLAIADRDAIVLAARSLGREQRLSIATLAAALAIPVVVMSIAFAGTHVPLSPHDGAFHTETIEAFRLGQARPDWYPPGMAALFAAWLQGVPWLDSAEGAFDLGMAIPLLAALGVFGLGIAVWRDLRMAAASALLLGFTYVYPFFPELWSGWPLATSVVLAMGVWTVSLEYLNQPRARLGVLAGLILGGTVLVHGTELLTSLIVLSVVCAARLRQVAWRVLPRDLGLAALVALVSAAVYLPTLVHWAAGGGAYAAGLEDAGVGVGVGGASPSVTPGPSLFEVFALEALGIDLPIRVALLAIGIGWAFHQRTGRSVLATGAVFAAIASTFSFLSRLGPIHQLYAATFPWGMHYRLFMLVAIAQVLLAGAGGVVGLRLISRWTSRPTAWARRLRRLTRLVVVTWLGLLTVGTALFLAYPTRLVLGYTPDDASAMAWLHDNAAPGAVLVNDGDADAGIWAPYKAGVRILLPRISTYADASRAALVIDHVAHLEDAPDAAAVVCALDVVYVYRGAHASDWDARRFPPLPELRASPALEEVFASGEAVVFRVRLPCAR